MVKTSFVGFLPDGVTGLYVGTGTPEGSVTATIGSLYSRKDGTAGATLYVKESGTGNTGWNTAGSGAAYTDEQAQDAVAAMLAAGTHTNLTVTYDDATNSLDLDATGSGGGSSTMEALVNTYNPRNTVYAGGAKFDLRSHGACSITSGSNVATGTNYQASNGAVGKLAKIHGAGTTLLTNTNGSMSLAVEIDKNLLIGTGFDRSLTGKHITITGVGAAGVTMKSVVWGVIDSTHLRVKNEAATAVSGTATYTISEDLYGTVTASTATTLTLDTNAGTTVTAAENWVGTDDYAAIQAAITAGEAATGPTGNTIGGNGYEVVLSGPAAIGTGLVMTKPGTIRGIGSPGYSKTLAHGTTRLHTMKPKLVALTIGGSNSGMGVRGTVTSNGTNLVLTDPDANFPVGMTGAVYVMSAGIQTGSMTQGFLVTTILSRDSATQLTLAATPSQGTLVTDQPYSTRGSVIGTLAGPTLKNFQIEGGSGQICGIHLMGIGGYRLEDVTVSDFPSGVAFFSDRGAGFSAECVFDGRCNFCDSRICMLMWGTGWVVDGNLNCDGLSNLIGVYPGPGTIGIASNNSGLSSFGLTNCQGNETWGRFDGSGRSTIYGLRSESSPEGLILGTDGVNGLRGTRIRCSSWSNTSLGTSGKGLVLLPGLSDIGFDPGYYIDNDTNMFGYCDATSLSKLRRLDDESIVKAGPISDADFSHPPFDGWLGVDTLNKNLQIRIGGAWGYVPVTIQPSRVKLIDTKENLTSATTRVLTVPTGGVAAGHHIIIGWMYSAAANRTLTITDSQSNTWQNDAVANMTTGQTPHAGISSCRVTTPLAAGDTITLTLDVSSAFLSASAYDYVSLATSSWLDQASATGTGTGTTPVSASITTATAKDILFGVVCNGHATTLATWTEDTSWTRLISDALGGSKRFNVEDRNVLATGSYTAGGTLSASNDWAACIAAYKGA